MSDEKAIRESLNETVQSKTQVYHGRVANIDVWDEGDRFDIFAACSSGNVIKYELSL